MSGQYGPKLVWLVCVSTLFFTGCAAMADGDGSPRDLDLIERWSGDYPVARLDLLPEDQRQSRVGYIGDQSTFASVWQVLMPGEKTPEVDFERNLAVFSRNMDFYNRTNILKVTLSGGGAEVLAMETMSAMPIEDKVAMAMAIVPRAGIDFIKAGDARIAVTR